MLLKKTISPADSSNTKYKLKELEDGNIRLCHFSDDLKIIQYAIMPKK